MAKLQLEKLNKVYSDSRQAVRDFSLRMEEKEFLVLTGPVGCGKTTALRIVAGLEEPSSGKVFIDGEDVTDFDPRKRKLAMLFKNSVLYPNLTVRENLAFSLRLDKLSQKETEERISAVAKELPLSSLLDSLPEALKPEETFRALLARALVRKPEFLLLDGPLEGMEPELQGAALRHLKEAYRKTDVSVIYAAAKGDPAIMEGTRVVVMREGSFYQEGNPRELRERPSDIFTAKNIIHPWLNVFSGKVIEEDGRAFLEILGGRLSLTKETGLRLGTLGLFGKQVFLGVRPGGLAMVSDEDAGGFLVSIQSVKEEMGGMHVKFAEGETEGECLVKDPSFDPARKRIRLTADLENAYFFDHETGKNLF